ncbi:PREDICTED: zinc finger protein 483 isoform X2 [Wasmannia auropunctata]|uniref:zinc finger protein 483 isoform X2 n=1 Tax=Wasmannia auropunctata TaxID=64793 RepID=UPI0005EFEBF9|nr:PREDICTED: zinc finger protein 483 isoform X2 [Wasmannia auropunctata]
MGLLLSVLVGCVGVLELLACLRHASDSVVISISPPTPCLSYHEPANNDIQSIHDSLCSFSHSIDVRLPRDAKHKLENLHEYSLRVRSELRSLGKNFDGRSTLSECSTRYLLGGGSRPDSRLSPDSRISPDFSYLVREDDETWIVQADRHYDDDNDDYIETKRFLEEINTEIRESLQQVARSLAPPEPKKYVRLPTPIPFAHDENKISASSSEVDTSFDKDSGNEAPTMSSFDDILSIIKRYRDSQSASSVDESDHEEIKLARRAPRKSSSKSPDLSKKSKNVDVSKKMKKLSNDHTKIDWTAQEPAVEENKTTKICATKKTFVSQKKPRSGKSSTTISRKPTRLKSKNAEISKSAENLSTKKSRKNHDPERRKSDISVQTVCDLLRDMSTNTSPTNSPSLSRSESKKSVSVEVQTVLEDILFDDEVLEELVSSVIGLSESRRDLSSRGSSARKSFKSKRFRPSSSSRDQSDDQDKQIYTAINAVTSVERSRRDKTKTLKVSRFENASEEDYGIVRDVIFDSSKGSSVSRRRWEDSRSKSSLEDDDEFVDAEDLIFSGEYTKAMNKDWHSGHFCCWQCDESLTGQRYVLRDEHPYCIKCYESVFANGCEECSKIIGIDSKDLSYKDKHWHEACFLCNRCRVSLVDKQFGSKVDKIYCGNCYDAQFASRCDGCGEIFRAGTKKMEYKTRQWHEKCFCCVVCKNPIGTKSFIPREQEIYCAGCYEDKFATRCVKCNKIITSGGVTYKNEPWHRDCFTCSNCNNSLAGQRFTSRDDKPYCADCFGELFAKRCTACSKPITGIGGTRFISFEDRHWHNDCFICAGCKTSLVGRGFITDGDDIICPECAKMKLM